jgi:hypothetical protein
VAGILRRGGRKGKSGEEKEEDKEGVCKKLF